MSNATSYLHLDRNIIKLKNTREKARESSHDVKM